MKRKIKLAFVMALTATVFTAHPAFGQPKGPKVTIKGEVVDLWCYLEAGDHSAKHKDCATACAKAGNPIGILDAKGNVYVAVGLQDHQPGQELLAGKMAETVTVTGTLVKKRGTQLIYVSAVQ